MALLSVFTQAILPLVAVVGSGIVLGWSRDIDSGPLNTVTVYILLPALVFHSIATTELPAETLVSVGAGVVGLVLAMTVISELVARAVGETEPLLGTFVLMTVFPNAGNYGLPVAEFTFGSLGRATAVVYIIVLLVLMNTLGVYLASRGGSGTLLAGLKTVASVPLVYAVLLAALARGAGVIPASDAATMQTLKLVGDSAIPVALIVLGLELADTRPRRDLFVRISPAAVVKMFVGPLVAVVLVLTLSIQNDVVASAFVLLAATPSAVTPLIIATEFSEESDGDLTVGEYASNTILLTTVLSIPIITILTFLLKSDLVL